MKERKALLDALQKSLQASEEESEAEIAILLSDAKESAEELWTSYKNEMQETCAIYLSKTLTIAEKHNLSEEEKNEIEADIGTMFQQHDEEEDHAKVEDVKADPVKKRGRPKGSKNVKPAVMKPASSKKKGKVNEQVVLDDETDDDEEEDVAVTKRPKTKSPGKITANSRPRGRPPAGMQWSESNHKWVPMKLALRRIMDSPMHGAPEGMQWDATKEDWVPMKKALKRLM